MVEYLMFGVCVASCGYIAYQQYRMHELLKLCIEPQLPELSEEEIDRLEKSIAFNSRIEKIKEELAEVPSVYTNSPADELHPAVKNLPHEIIDTKLYPDEEYAK